MTAPVIRISRGIDLTNQVVKVNCNNNYRVSTTNVEQSIKAALIDITNMWHPRNADDRDPYPMFSRKDFSMDLGFTIYQRQDRPVENMQLKESGHPREGTSVESVEVDWCRINPQNMPEFFVSRNLVEYLESSAIEIQNSSRQAVRQFSVTEVPRTRDDNRVL